MKESLLKKSERKIQTLLGKYVPHNTHYKPRGVYQDVRALQEGPAGQGAALTEVYPAHVSDFYMTEEFGKVCSDYLRPSPATPFPPAYVAAVPNARLFTDPIQSNVAVISPTTLLSADITATFDWIGSVKRRASGTAATYAGGNGVAGLGRK